MSLGAGDSGSESESVNGGPHRRRPNVTVHLGGTGRSQPRRHHRPGPSEPAPASATSGAEAARDCRQGRWRPVTRSVRVLHLTLSVSLPHCPPPTSYAGSVASYSPSLARISVAPPPHIHGERRRRRHHPPHSQSAHPRVPARVAQNFSTDGAFGTGRARCEQRRDAAVPRSPTHLDPVALAQDLGPKAPVPSAKVSSSP